MKSGRSITDREEHYRKQNTDPEVKNTIIGNSGYYGLDFDNLPDGIIIDNRFEIKQKLGQGGFGSVYKVWDRNLDILKALKVISREFYNDDEVIYDLKHEAKILIKLKHENILYFYDIHFEGDCKYLDMEYIDGDNLVRIKLSYPGKKITEEKALELIRQICQGMIYIHDHNIIHKDLKPHNIMIDSHGTVKIMDFGISETFRTSMSRIKETSKSGTPAYMSPEQLIGEDVGKESDIWSFGIMLYELLSGKQVFTGESRNDVLMQIERRKEYKPIESISDKLNTLLEKCLRYDYKDRFGSFKELLDFMDSTESEPLKSTLTEKPAPATSTDRIIMKPSKSILTDNMVFVEGGEFEMGDTFGDGEDYEKPVHKVFVDSFLIGKYPVTKKEYEEIMGKVRYLIQGEDHPVDVSWYNAVEFCNKLSIREGLTPCYNGSGYKIKCDFNANGYRLPTEAEWEYAARGGNKSRGYKYSGSSDLDAVGWYNDNSENKTHPIGQKEPNELGIYDMSGNVSEWCWDLGDDDYYKDSPAKNPQGSTTGSRRVARGGCWFRIPAYCRVSSRIGVYPDYSRADLGFRLLRSSPR
ncbi:MAG: SUMF1/EgtB/PvdO family nonheme iron enzyme [Candidatus Delongbacteria bacterium]|nr:SUMF1/EgtB/PvdO family nonheme iron enzyme [Candidatus Delongbacteria bacterium]